MATRKKETAKEKALKDRRTRAEAAAPGQIGRASRSSRRAIEGAKGMEPSGDTRAIQRRKAIAGVKAGEMQKMTPAKRRAYLATDRGSGKARTPSVMEAGAREDTPLRMTRTRSAPGGYMGQRLDFQGRRPIRPSARARQTERQQREAQARILQQRQRARKAKKK